MSVAVLPPLAKLSPVRGSLLLACLLVLFVLLLLRALQLQTTERSFLQEEGNARTMRVVEEIATRGEIRDRNGEILAVSTPLQSVWVSRADLKMNDEQAAALASLLGMKPGELAVKLEREQPAFFYLKRQITPDLAERVKALDIRGLVLLREYRRYYPDGEVTAHVVGFTDIDDKGQEGLELAFNSTLAGTPGSRRVIRDARGHIIEDVESIREPENGEDLTLSIDRSIQYLAYRALKKAVADNRAKAGAAVVLNARTGEILALVNQPSFNPNNRASIKPDHYRNRVLTDIYEPGSTMKPFTVAAALEAGRIRPDTRIDTGDGTFTIGNRTIRDTHPGGVMTVEQVIQKSSNVGAARIALGLSPAYMWNIFHHLGLGAPPHSGFPGEASGVVRDYHHWRPIEQATMAYGHGISVSLLQLARAYTVFANGGGLLPVTLFKQQGEVERQQVYSPATAVAMLNMMEKVTQPGGTAPKAHIPGYLVAGKTGTAHKLQGGHYVNEYIASFVGLAPATDPQLIVAVMIDEPSAGAYYGGTVAAPAFTEIMAGALRLRNVPPDAPHEVQYDWSKVPEIGEGT